MSERPKGGTLALSWGRYGGFYVHRYRICLGWVALTWMPIDLDDVLRWAAERPDPRPESSA